MADQVPVALSLVIAKESVVPQVTLVLKGPRTTTFVAFGAQTWKVTPVTLVPLLLMIAPKGRFVCPKQKAGQQIQANAKNLLRRLCCF